MRLVHLLLLTLTLTPGRCEDAAPGLQESGEGLVSSQPAGNRAALVRRRGRKHRDGFVTLMVQQVATE